MKSKIHQHIPKLTETSPWASTKHHNRLFLEKSPYLLQHAYNPVDWYPWGHEAFEEAASKDKPIFLSIGYSTCHWCHVMERESFEDPGVARLMNDAFVSIKVDREERPDLDNMYMTVCQMITGRGGWPLSIFMTPDKKPFFAATYVPKNSHPGQIGMIELIPRIKEFWSHRRGEVTDSADTIASALLQISQNTSGEDLDESVLTRGFEHLAATFDQKLGGFGSAPKFPIPHNLLFLLRYWKRTGNKQALDMVEKTLLAMRNGGMYDHVGFGFHRYSTDAEWLVPHFEKMLYDQALLAMAYTEAYQATRKVIYRTTSREIFSYVLRDMTSPEGGFYSAEDADSEGEEGAFYLWTPDEIRHVLDNEEADMVIKAFSIHDDGNFVEQTLGKKTGKNILHLEGSWHSLAADLRISEEDVEKRLERARQKLFAAREKRIHPHKDDKILTDWNALMIAAFAKGAQVFDDPLLVKAARNSADFILTTLRTPAGRLLHRYRDGEAAIHAHVDDYAFLIWGLIELYEATFEEIYLHAALSLNEQLVERFWDQDKGGFYFTAHDNEELLVRQKEIYDGALPSGNSVAMLNLLRLSRMTGLHRLEDMATRIVQAFSRSIRQSPAVYTQLLVAQDFRIGPSFEVVIAGTSDADDTTAMIHALRAPFVPNKVVLFRPAEQDAPGITEIAEFTKNQSCINGKAAAYVCVNHTCSLPTTDTHTMLDLLNAARGSHI